tara:strand:+ start:317 stop:730 length:414 start_codon:yes stop_codon:yes gene_type:complete
MSVNGNGDKLLEAAKGARDNAHAPYSKFKVGAAVQIGDDIYTGVNVENASYGLTVCAERNALAAAQAAGADFKEASCITIVTEAPCPTPPCGACRQVMAEFLSSKTQIVMHNQQDNSTQKLTLAELLPHSFKTSHLP